jgi:hypothetical protein
MWRAHTQDSQSLFVGFLLAIFGLLMLFVGWLRWAL